MDQKRINSMLKKIISERGTRVHFMVIANDSGEENFFYLFMKESDYEKMQEKINNGEKIEPAKFGEVIFQGVGNTPPPELDEMIMSIVNKNR